MVLLLLFFIIARLTLSVEKPGGVQQLPSWSTNS